jgi:citrate lyase subunit beta/citryl-CoA lyase
VAFDLEGSGESGRALVKESIPVATRGGAEVFVRINPALAYADIEASAWPGLTGVMLPDAETAQDIGDVAEVLTQMERAHGIPIGSLQIFPLLNTAAGIWNIREVLTASDRVSSVAIEETRLCASIGILPPADDFDPLHWARGRVILESIAVGRHPIGLVPPMSYRPRNLPHEEFATLAARARNHGFKGAICLDPSWVAASNEGFSPSDEGVAYHRKVRETFAVGVARGTAAVPLDGRMVDVPVDERARMTIAWWERCKKRDAEKAEALAANATVAV